MTHRALEKLRKHVRSALGAGVFFAVAFSLIVLADRLMGRGSEFQIASFTRAIVGGWIVAKVLLVVDLLPFVDAFPGKPLVYNITWKTLIYVAASLIYRYIEPLITSLFMGAGGTAAHQHAVQPFMQTRFWAIEIWLALLFVIFVTMHELTRAVGKDKMRLLFFGR
jgi:hypothetical protein